MRNFVAAMAVGMLATACGKTPEANQPTQVATVEQPSHIAPPPSAVTFEVFHNLEMVEYCLPHPGAAFAEDFEESESRGHHVLVSKSGARVTFVGGMTDVNLQTYQQNYSESVKAAADGAVHAYEALPDGLQDQWQVGEEHHFVRKWVREKDQETVSAELSCPQSQAGEFAEWVGALLHHTSRCE